MTKTIHTLDEIENKAAFPSVSRKLYNYTIQPSPEHHTNTQKVMGDERSPIGKKPDPSTKPKVVLFYKNGDRNFRGHHVTVTPRRFRNFDGLLTELTRITNLAAGARCVFTPVNGTQINSLNELEDGKSYVCGSNTKFKKINYNHAPDGSVRTKTNERNFIPAHMNNNKMRIETPEKLPSNVKPKIITIVRNSVNRPKKCVNILLNKRTAQSYNQVLNDITEAAGIEGGGAVRKLYNTEGKLVKDLTELFSDANIFIAVGTERFRSADVPHILEDLKKSSNVKLPSSSSNKLSRLKNNSSKDSHESDEAESTKSSLPSLKKLPEIPKSRVPANHSSPIQRNGTPVLPDIGTPTKVTSNGVRETHSRDHIISTHTPPTSTNNASTPELSNTANLMNKKKPLPSIGTSSAASSSRASESGSQNGLPSHSSESTSDAASNPSDVKPRTPLQTDLSSSISSSTGKLDSAPGTKNASEVQPDKDDSSEEDEVVHVDLEDDMLNHDAPVEEEESRESAVVDGNLNGAKESSAEDASSETDGTETETETATEAGTEAETDTGTEAETEVAEGAEAEPETETETETETDIDEENSDTDKNETSGRPVNSPPLTNGEKSNLSVPKIFAPSKRYIDHQLDSSKEIDLYYDVGESLGDGNFAVVKTAVDKKTNTMYALKIIDASKIKGKEEMLKNEILIQRTSRHPNLVQLIHDFHSPTEIFLVMELIAGGDLFDLIAENVRFEEEEAALYTRDLCSGLDYLHRRTIVHRDIKPENLMVCTSSDGSVSLKIADFGLAQKVTEPIFTICGTPTYVSPEILKEKGYGVEVDVWAAGVIIYIMLCGFPPFRSPNRRQSELFDLIETGEFEYLEPYWDEVSELAKDLIDHVLVVDTTARFTCADILKHPWLTQHHLIRNNTMDLSPRPSRLRIAAKGVVAVERMKRMAGDKLERGENFIDSLSLHSTTVSAVSATTTTDS